jgi:hypothetical protein
MRFPAVRRPVGCEACGAGLLCLVFWLTLRFLSWTSCALNSCITLGNTSGLVGFGSIMQYGVGYRLKTGCIVVCYSSYGN